MKSKSCNFYHTNTKNPGDNPGIFLFLTIRLILNGYGRNVPDKVKRVGFTATHSPNVDAPIINEYKLTLECRLLTMDENKEGGAHIVGEVVNWSADESILTDGKVDLAKLKPIVFDSSSLIYRSVGDSVGQAWQSGKIYK